MHGVITLYANRAITYARYAQFAMHVLGMFQKP